MSQVSNARKPRASGKGLAKEGCDTAETRQQGP